MAANTIILPWSTEGYWDLPVAYIQHLVRVQWIQHYWVHVQIFWYYQLMDSIGRQYIAIVKFSRIRMAQVVHSWKEVNKQTWSGSFGSEMDTRSSPAQSYIVACGILIEISFSTRAKDLLVLYWKLTFSTRTATGVWQLLLSSLSCSLASGSMMDIEDRTMFSDWGIAGSREDARRLDTWDFWKKIWKKNSL